MSNPLINKLRFGHTKWFGGNRQLIKDDDPDWTCQACATRHPREMPCFFFEVFEEEFIKLCVKCHNITKRENIVEFELLVQKVRRG